MSKLLQSQWEITMRSVMDFILHISAGSLVAALWLCLRGKIGTSWPQQLLSGLSLFFWGVVCMVCGLFVMARVNVRLQNSGLDGFALSVLCYIPALAVVLSASLLAGCIVARIAVVRKSDIVVAITIAGALPLVLLFALVWIALHFLPYDLLWYP
jgi:hypothetical protein